MAHAPPPQVREGGQRGRCNPEKTKSWICSSAQTIQKRWYPAGAQLAPAIRSPDTSAELAWKPVLIRDSPSESHGRVNCTINNLQRNPPTVILFFFFFDLQRAAEPAPQCTALQGEDAKPPMLRCSPLPSPPRHKAPLLAAMTATSVSLP